MRLRTPGAFRSSSNLLFPFPERSAVPQAVALGPGKPAPTANGVQSDGFHGAGGLLRRGLREPPVYVLSGPASGACAMFMLMADPLGGGVLVRPGCRAWRVRRSRTGRHP